MPTEIDPPAVTPARTKTRRRQGALLFMVGLTMASLALVDNGRAAVYPDLLRTFAIGTGAGSWIFTAASIGGLAINLSVPFWFQRVGALRGLRIALALIAVGAAGTALTGRAAGPLGALYGASFVLGLGISLAALAMNVLVVRGTEPARRRRALAGLHSIYGLASLSAPLVLSAFLWLQLSWPVFLLTLSALPALVLVGSLRADQPGPGPAPAARVRGVLRAPAPARVRLVYGAAFACYVACELTVSSRLVLYAERGLQLGPDRAHLLLSAFFGCLLAGRLALTAVRVRGNAVVILQGCAAASLALLGLGLFVSPWFLSASGLAMAWIYPLGIEWLEQTFGEGFEYMASSSMVAMNVGLVGMHFGFGRLASSVGVQRAMLIAPALAVATFVLFGLAAADARRRAG